MTNPQDPAPEVAATPSSAGLKAGLLAFVLLVAVVGYALMGNRSAWLAGPHDSAALRQIESQAAQGGTPGPEQIEAMLQQLQKRLDQAPDDAEGWAMLGRSFAALGRHPEAVVAYRKLLAIQPKDAQVHADLADAIGMSQGRSLDGEPAKLIDQALVLDPRNLKALALGGTVALNTGKPAEAIALWERAKAVAGTEGAMAQTLDGGIAEARQRLGAGAAPAASAAPAGDAAKAAATAASAVAGRVSLAPELAARAAPGDTVFIFARAAQGQRVPLAIQRVQVKDLPLDFSLDDSHAMSPAARLSGAQQVVVGARISKSGNAMPQPGDLQALSAPVAVGTRGLQLTIAEVLQ